MARGVRIATRGAAAKRDTPYTNKPHSHRPRTYQRQAYPFRRVTSQLLLGLYLTVEPADEILARMAAGGDGAAFETLVQRHYGDCLRYAMRLLGSRHDAEEVVQDTFVRAHRSLPRYENRHRFRAWLFRILVNRCRSAAKTGARRLERMSAYARDHAAVEPPPGRDLDRLARIQRALLQLPVRQREAFLLKHVEGLSYDEMAALNGQRVSTLKMRVKRARDRLQVLLEDVFDD